MSVLMPLLYSFVSITSTITVLTKTISTIFTLSRCTFWDGVQRFGGNQNLFLNVLKIRD